MKPDDPAAPRSPFRRVLRALRQAEEEGAPGSLFRATTRHRTRDEQRALLAGVVQNPPNDPREDAARSVVHNPGSKGGPKAGRFGPPEAESE